MAQFTYHPVASRDETTTVKLDGKVIGKIVGVKDGFYYTPKGSKARGETFPTERACKRSIEGDSMPLSLVKTREAAYPFDDESDTRLACMEARDAVSGVCAREPSTAFRYESLTGETGIYVVYYKLATDETFYLTRGSR